MFCGKCGAALEENQNYCAICGTKIKQEGLNPSLEQKVNRNEFQNELINDFGHFLADFSLMLTRWFLWLLCGGMVFACGISGLNALFICVYSFYCFGVGKAMVIPEFLAEEMEITAISGSYLVFTGIGTTIIAVVLFAAVICMVKGMKWLHERNCKKNRE